MENFKENFVEMHTNFACEVDEKINKLADQESVAHLVKGVRVNLENMLDMLALVESGEEVGTFVRPERVIRVGDFASGYKEKRIPPKTIGGEVLQSKRAIERRIEKLGSEEPGMANDVAYIC